MKDISIADYLGPGVYLLYNYPQQSGMLIAEKGYKVCYCDDLASLGNISAINKADFLLISDIEGQPDKYIVILELLAKTSIKKVVIDTLVKEKQEDLYFKLVQASLLLNYRLDSAFSLLNPEYDRSFRNDQHLKIVLDHSKEQLINIEEIDSQLTIVEKKVLPTLTYVRSGDRVLVVSSVEKLASNIKNIYSEQSKASSVNICTLAHIEKGITKDCAYHFIFVDDCEDANLLNKLGSITSSLLPAGRCVFLNASPALVDALDKNNIQPEVYFLYEHNNLRPHIHQGEVITEAPELCVFMKSPLENTSLEYEETIYGYSYPPKNLLAFARDYTNPWLIRGIVEFPFRNRSTYHLRKYSQQILRQFHPTSPDYAAALAVLGYQLLSNGDDYDDILNKILTYCVDVQNITAPTPHQNRWYISLSALLGLIYNKNNDKIRALVHFSHASNVCVDKFSPSIGTKTLQSLYLQTIILISLNKTSCAEITVERGIKRGIQLLYQQPDELIGKISQPFNFVLFIYHDIIDWLIKLVNIKNAISSKKFNIAYHDNSNTWSALLHSRMSAINSMSQMIDERDNTINSQKNLIDERDSTILAQKNLIDERDATIHSQKSMIDERDKTIQQQNLLVEALRVEIDVREQRITELVHKKDELIVISDEKALHLTQLSADLEQARSTLCKINSIPLIGRLLRILNIK